MREDEGFAKVSISARGDLAEEITVEIVPLSFEEYRDSGYFSFNEVSMDVDHATPSEYSMHLVVCPDVKYTAIQI